MKKIVTYLILFIIGILVLFQVYYYINFLGGRVLTVGEIKISKEIYFDKIDYSKVKIHCHKFMPNFVQDDWTAIAPNGNIFLPKNICPNDFSKETIMDQSWFIHEMGHVYQYQTDGQLLFWKATKLVIWDTWLKGKDVYYYKIDKNKKIDDYNVEQQGDIFSDYFLFLHGVKHFTLQETQWYHGVSF